jgi:type I site-specific restriction-modification system R (restriction) subunit
LGIVDEYIPGTKMLKKDMGDVTGLDFLNKIFFITDGIMLQQIREICGVDGSTIQNWVKRGWVMNSVNKKYDKDQLARILIINMLRDSMRLEHIDFLLRYINGNVNDRLDDIISESQLYDYICNIIDKMMEDESTTHDQLKTYIRDCTEVYIERVSGARRRLQYSLEIIVTVYYAASVQRYSNLLFENLAKGE